MNLSEINRTLREIRVTPVKTLGQNFLHDQNVARSIVEEAGIGSGDFVLEVGPGLGALSEPALAAGARVLAIEKDARLAEFLRGRFPQTQFEIIHGDALEFDVRQLFPRGPTTLLGNLPYSTGTPILLRFLGKTSPITSAVLMLQMEVANRIAAKPGSGAFGVLSLIVQERCHAEFLRAVPPQVFSPEPAVESAVVRLVPRAPGELPEHDEQMFAQLVRLGFSQRRKQVGKLLKPHVGHWLAAAEKIGASPQARAEEISLTQWIALTNLVRPLPMQESANDPNELFAVVDENDRVSRAAPRAEVHGNNLRHRAVHLFIFSRAGELLLQKRSRWKDRHPNVWDSSAAGHVDAGEDYDQTAARELQEELGITTELTPVAKISASERTGEEFIRVYRGESEGPFQRARTEIDALEFFPLDLIDRWIKKRPGDFAPGFLECWRALPTDRPTPA